MSGKQKVQIHARLAKYDEDTHTFEAVATDESIDKTLERMNYDRSKPHFINWSQEFAKATDGKSVGNLRSMHGKNAAGCLKALVCDDEAKAIIIRGEIVDPNDQVKMAKGVYTGVSIGGEVLDRWADEANKGVFWYEANPVEISLVDNPCNPNARFLKMAGGVETEAPLVGDPEAAAARAKDEAEKAAVDQLAKLLDARTVLPSAVVKLVEAELAKGAEAAQAARRAELKKALQNPELTLGDLEKVAQEWLPEGFKGDVPAILAALFKAGGFTPDELTEIENAAPAALPLPAAESRPLKLKSAEDVAKALAAVQKLGEPANLLLQKNLYGLCNLAQLLEQLWWAARDAAAEAAYEGDASMIPDRLRMLCAELGEIVCEMAEEETQEEGEKGVLAGNLRKAFEKAGARHSAKDAERLQKIHDHSVDMGAKCSGSAKSTGGDLAKLLGVGDDDLVKAVTVLREKAAKWDAQPVRKGLRALSKGEEIDNGPDAAQQHHPAVVEKVRAAKSGDLQAHLWLVRQGYGGADDPAFTNIK